MRFNHFKNNKTRMYGAYKIAHELSMWVIPCETTEKKLDVPKIVLNFLALLVYPNEE